MTSKFFLSIGSTLFILLVSTDTIILFSSLGSFNALVTFVPPPNGTRQTSCFFARLINLRTSFSDLRANNTIDKIESSFYSATLFIDELNATIAIDKEELGLKAFSNQKVTIEQIPDLAKMKSFIVWFY